MSEALWTGEEFATAIGGKVIGKLPQAIHGISIDSRSLIKGDAFFAIRGEKFDGHDFAQAAIQAGSSVLVVNSSHAERLCLFNVPLIIVPDVLVALENLGRQARLRTKAKIIAVTGSVGKTTTKEALRHLLGQVGKVHFSPASFNNHWGVPLTLARMPQASDFAVFEIGMNHTGEIHALAKQVRPDIALITCVASVHSAYFSSLEEIARAKAEIFDGLENGGTVLLNRDDGQFELLRQIARNCGIENIIGFGENAACDYRLLKMQTHDNYCDCQFSLRGKQVQARLGSPGHHMAMNITACLAVCDILQLDDAKILPALADFTPPDGRGARHILHLPNGQTCLLLDESYNANPTSMRATLQVLANTKPKASGRRIAVLGDMLELGDVSRQAHEALIQPLSEAHVDLVFLLGQEMLVLATLLQHKGKEVIWRETWQELTPLVASNLTPGDVISVKSSKATGASHIVAALLNDFSIVFNAQQS